MLQAYLYVTYKNATMTINLQQNTDGCYTNKKRNGDDVISPKLFTLVVESMFRSVDLANYSININGSKLSHFRFIHHIILISSTLEEAQTITEQLTSLRENMIENEFTEQVNDKHLRNEKSDYK